MGTGNVIGWTSYCKHQKDYKVRPSLEFNEYEFVRCEGGVKP